MTCIYLTGSLRNPKIPEIGNLLRSDGLEVFDDWHSAGPTADDEWMKYEKGRGHSYAKALKGWAANHTFAYDHRHLLRADAAILVMPAGKSSHLELGFFVGLGKPGYVLFDKEPDRYDVMYLFATDVFFNIEHMRENLRRLSR